MVFRLMWVGKLQIADFMVPGFLAEQTSYEGEHLLDETP